MAESVENDTSKAELGEAARKLREVHATVQTFLDQQQEGNVYWVERGGREEIQYSLHAAPVEVASVLNRLLFAPEKTCIMASATLGVGDPSLGWFKKRVGAEHVRSMCIGSPFDYQKQMSVKIFRDMPEPQDRNYSKALAKAIQMSVEASEGRAFVLFTSYRAMRDAAAQLESFFRKKGWQLLVQGADMTRHRMVEEFRKDVHSVLFGADSFWTGVDVPGEALSNVIVTRLPFAVPDHPLTQSRVEAIEAGGGNAFMEYSVPEAILKFRQGVGRLIRTTKDVGMVHRLGNRMVTKRYGKNVLAAWRDAPEKSRTDESPPSGRRTCPVMNELWSLSRKSSMATMSAGCPTTCSGCRFAAAWRLVSSLSSDCASGVSVSEGAITLTRITGAHSAARLRARASSAPLAAAIDAWKGMPWATAMVEKRTTEALPLAFRAGSADCSA